MKRQEDRDGRNGRGGRGDKARGNRRKIGNEKRTQRQENLELHCIMEGVHNSFALGYHNSFVAFISSLLQITAKIREQV